MAFITDFNKANGRGGQTAAAEKYGVTQLTISKWLKKAGVKKGGRKPKAAAEAAAPVAKKGRGKGKGKAAVKTSGKAKSSGSLDDVFARMIQIRKQIEDLQAEFDALKAQL
ncbi:MAG: hypothetical protein JNK37_07570 [Verrucomicrobiales bacterium]|nr:hypothetical protein [Verrucomicrobiales bacterium]